MPLDDHVLDSNPMYLVPRAAKIVINKKNVIPRKLSKKQKFVNFFSFVFYLLIKLHFIVCWSLSYQKKPHELAVLGQTGSSFILFLDYKE